MNDFKNSIRKYKENQSLRFSFFNGKKIKIKDLNNKNVMKKFVKYIFAAI